METIKIDRNGTKWYYKNGKLHRDGDLPAIENRDGEKHYYKNGKRHRDGNLPAVELPNGMIRYYKNGKQHRDGNLPAVELPDGTKYYYKNGELHRDGDLPAIEFSDGDKEYWKNGIEYAKEQVEIMTKMEKKRNKKRTMKIFRYWYDKTYSDPNSEAFKSMMIRDMHALEKEIGYMLSSE